MLNPFPTMWLALLAYFILRIGVALSFWQLARNHAARISHCSGSTKFIVATIALAELFIGTLLFIGFSTQYAALAGMTVLTVTAFCNRQLGLMPQARPYNILLFTVLLSLFITGAGAFAFDLPL